MHQSVECEDELLFKNQVVLRRRKRIALSEVRESSLRAMEMMERAMREKSELREDGLWA